MKGQWIYEDGFLRNKAGIWPLSHHNWLLPYKGYVGVIKDGRPADITPKRNKTTVLAIVDDITGEVEERNLIKIDNGALGQQWEVIELGDNSDYFGIRNPSSGKLLVAHDNGLAIQGMYAFEKIKTNTYVK